MGLSNAVDSNALSRVVGYGLDYKDLQTSAAVLPIKILVLSDLGTGANGTKILNATREKVLDALGADTLGGEVMRILDELKNAQYIDVLAVDTQLNTEADTDRLKSTIISGLGDVWYNVIVNSFGVNQEIYAILREINGAPSEDGGTGRWNAIQVKPFVAISGTNSEIITPLLSTDLTNIIGTAPRAFVNNPKITTAQANARIAASYAFLMYKQFSSKPYLDLAGKYLPYIEPPVDANIGSMEEYDKRDAVAKNGICTVMFDRPAFAYVVQDFITGYRPTEQGELAKSWRYVRDLFVDFNIAFNYNVLQTKKLLGKVIVLDSEIIQTDRKADVIRLKMWKADVLAFLEQMVGLAYITDLEFAKENLFVEISGTNPKRLNTQFAYKRTSVVGIASTTAYVGFLFGSE